VLDHGGNDPASQICGNGIAFGLRQMAFQDRRRRPLAEVSLKDRRQREAPAGPERPDVIGRVRLHVEEVL
jgi:hypothetical protein